MTTPQGSKGIVFRGRSRADAKRKALNYWYLYRRQLSLSIREFSENLVFSEDEKTIFFKKP